MSDIQLNIEALKEEIAALQLAQERDNLVLYGNQEIRIEGLISKVERNQLNIKAINGIPGQVRDLAQKVDNLIEASKKRQWIMTGVIIGITLQVLDLLGVLDLLKALL